MGAFDNQFLTPDKRVAELLAAAVLKGCAVGVGDHSTAAMHKDQQTAFRLDDRLLNRDYVEEIVRDVTVLAMKKCRAYGVRTETGNTMSDLRKGVGLPPQSSNGQDIEASPTRAGAQTGVGMYHAGPSDQSAPRMGPSASAAIRSTEALPTDPDDAWKREYAKATRNPKPLFG